DGRWKAIADGIKQTIESLCAGSFFGAVAPVAQLPPATYIFLCDRSEQERRFRAALAGAPRNRPFLCILHGDNRPGHREVIDRLERSAIPDTLQLSQAIYHPQADVSWARLDDTSVLGDELRASIEPTPSSSGKAQIAAALETHPGATVIRSVS